MTTDLELKEEFIDVFLASGFQESIIYTPSGSSAKTISAIIYREGTTQSTPSKRTGGSDNRTISRRYDIAIHISADATSGINIVTINKDQVQLKRRTNDTTNTKFLVRGIVQEDTGAYLLGLG